MKKPYSESCDQNKSAILSVISRLFSGCSEILEIGSGTGQHAVYFADKLPYLTWHTSDREQNLKGISMWLDESMLDNVVAPFELDVCTLQWPNIEVDAVFTANTFHIMSDNEIKCFMDGVSKVLKTQASLVIYGPFNYAGSYTSDSNASFDEWLKSRDPLSGIKNLEYVLQLSQKYGMKMVNDYEMPENNRILHFIKF